MDTNTDPAVFYQKGREYWHDMEANMSGMLGGYTCVNIYDVDESKQLLKKLFAETGLATSTKTKTCLDCGAGLDLFFPHHIGIYHCVWFQESAGSPNMCFRNFSTESIYSNKARGFSRFPKIILKKSTPKYLMCTLKESKNFSLLKVELTTAFGASGCLEMSPMRISCNFFENVPKFWIVHMDLLWSKIMFHRTMKISFTMKTCPYHGQWNPFAI